MIYLLLAKPDHRRRGRFLLPRVARRSSSRATTICQSLIGCGPGLRRSCGPPASAGAGSAATGYSLPRSLRATKNARRPLDSSVGASTPDGLAMSASISTISTSPLRGVKTAVAKKEGATASNNSTPSPAIRRTAVANRPDRMCSRRSRSARRCDPRWALARAKASLNGIHWAADKAGPWRGGGLVLRATFQRASATTLLATGGSSHSKARRERASECAPSEMCAE
jgi:hypothetical protein